MGCVHDLFEAELNSSDRIFLLLGEGDIVVFDEGGTEGVIDWRNDHVEPLLGRSRGGADVVVFKTEGGSIEDGADAFHDGSHVDPFAGGKGAFADVEVVFVVRVVGGGETLIGVSISHPGLIDMNYISSSIENGEAGGVTVKGLFEEARGLVGELFAEALIFAFEVKGVLS